MPSSSPQSAIQACRACRRLKRKCTKEMPSCSLCVRLNKTCDYPVSPRPETSLSPSVINRLRHLEQLLEVDQAEDLGSSLNGASGIASFITTGNTQPFPSSYFLDPDFFTPLSPDSLSSGQQPFMQQAIALLGPDRDAVCDEYLSTVHTWLPMISRKRLINELNYPTPETEARVTLLLLSMKLCAEIGAKTTQSPGERASEAPAYLFVRSVCASAEMSGFISMRLVQSLVLLAVYEFGHSIYPAAYLTLGRAARLGSMMGMHSRRHAQQLFTEPDTWTLREEQRRTWWAVFVLDRLANCETDGLPFSAPEPCSEDLLPINDIEWEEGRVGPNEPLLTTSFHSAHSLGPFARLCQAALILGKVLEHRGHKEQSMQDVAQLLLEAKQLHRTLELLEASLEPSSPAHSPGSGSSQAENPNLTALAFCSCARFLLYNQYACNEPDGGVARERVALETEMQHTSMEGIKVLATKTVPRIVYGLEQIAVSAMSEAAGARLTPLVFPCLYHAATECAWFIKEDHEQSMYQALRDIVQGIQLLSRSWRTGDDYMALLEGGGVMKLMNIDTASPSQDSMMSS